MRALGKGSWIILVVKSLMALCDILEWDKSGDRNISDGAPRGPRVQAAPRYNLLFEHPSLLPDREPHEGRNHAQLQ